VQQKQPLQLINKNKNITTKTIKINNKIHRIVAITITAVTTTTTTAMATTREII